MVHDPLATGDADGVHDNETGCTLFGWRREEGQEEELEGLVGDREGCDNESAVDGAAGADAGFDCFASCGEGS